MIRHFQKNVKSHVFLKSEKNKKRNLEHWYVLAGQVPAFQKARSQRRQTLATYYSRVFHSFIHRTTTRRTTKGQQLKVIKHATKDLFATRQQFGILAHILSPIGTLNALQLKQKSPFIAPLMPFLEKSVE